MKMDVIKSVLLLLFWRILILFIVLLCLAGHLHIICREKALLILLKSIAQYISLLLLIKLLKLVRAAHLLAIIKQRLRCNNLIIFLQLWVTLFGDIPIIFNDNTLHWIPSSCVTCAWIIVSFKVDISEILLIFRLLLLQNLRFATFSQELTGQFKLLNLRNLQILFQIIFDHGPTRYVFSGLLAGVGLLVIIVFVGWWFEWVRIWLLVENDTCSGFMGWANRRPERGWLTLIGNFGFLFFGLEQLVPIGL